MHSMHWPYWQEKTREVPGKKAPGRDKDIGALKLIWLIIIAVYLTLVYLGLGLLGFRFF